MPPSDKRERGPYASGVARREAILDATIELLADVGYHGMSLRDVARQVGISHPGVIYHFPSKEVLLMSVVDRYESQMGFDLEELERLSALPLLDTMLDVLARLNENPTIIEVETMLMVEAASELHPAHDHFEDRSVRLVELLHRCWLHLQQDGKVPASVDPTHIAEIQMAIYHGLLLRWHYNHEFQAAREMAHFLLSVFSLDTREELLLHFRDRGWIK